MYFIYQTAKILTFGIRFVEFDEEGKSIEGTAKGVSEYTSADKQIEALAEIVLAYLRFEDSTRARRFPAPGGFKGVMLIELVHACEKFAVFGNRGDSY